MAGRGSGAAVSAAPANAHVLIIEARYYTAIADELLKGAKAELEAAGATFEIVTVPGALEVPQALSLAVTAGLIPSDSAEARFDGCVVLGCVIRGETSHYETVCNNSNHWLMDVAIRHSVPLGNAILTVENEAQAMERAKGGRKSKGADAVRACLSLVAHARAFEEVLDGEVEV
jgi:6,7-dimethyl-8-ribityllumazine synthase